MTLVVLCLPRGLGHFKVFYLGDRVSSAIGARPRQSLEGQHGTCPRQMRTGARLRGCCASYRTRRHVPHEQDVHIWLFCMWTDMRTIMSRCPLALFAATSIHIPAISKDIDRVERLALQPHENRAEPCAGNPVTGIAMIQFERDKST